MQEAPSLAQMTDRDPFGRRSCIDAILAGGFPKIRTLSLRQRQRQYRDYIEAVVDRDVADVMPVRKPDALRILIDQMAARTAQEINTSEIARLTRLQRATVEQYIDILIRLSMVTKLGDWTSGDGKREIKQPKCHFVDTGMGCALRRLNEATFAVDNSLQLLGGLVKSYVVGELQRALPMQDFDFRLRHWRSADRREIDILIDGGRHLINIEIKASATVGGEDFKHLKWFAADGPGRSRKCTGIEFYLGQEELTFGDGNSALPASALRSDFAL